MILNLLYWMLGTGVAAPVGDPVPHPGTGLFHVDVGLALSQVREQDAKCGGDACFTNTERQGVDLEFGLAAWRGVGLYGVVGRHSDNIDEAKYEGSIGTVGGGVRLAVPLGVSTWVAATTDLRFGDSKSKQANRLSDPPIASESIYSSSVLLVLGDPANGGHLWFGPQAAWFWRHTLQPLGEEGVTVDVPLEPRVPVGGVFGGILTSDGIASPWRKTPLLRVSAEVRVGQETGVRVATGVSF